MKDFLKFQTEMLERNGIELKEIDAKSFVEFQKAYYNSDTSFVNFDLILKGWMEKK